MRRKGVWTNLFAALIILAATLLPASSASAAEGFALASGQFFTQTGDQPGTGFAVSDGGRDEAGHVIRFWSEFQRLGGVAALGYPISRVYKDDGFYYQLFQRALLQWRPEANRAALGNVLDQMSSSGADPWLATLGIPKPIADDGSKGDFATAVQVRLAWLTQPEIRAYYLGAGVNGSARQAIERFGLPTSPPVRAGPFVVQRFQRVALQLWVDAVPGMPARGSVVPVLAGDLFREAARAQGIGLSDGRFVPQLASSATASATAAVARIDEGLGFPLELLAANPEGREAARALQSPRVRIVFENLPSIALFSPSRLNVAVDSEYRNADPKALAAVLAHEGSHLADYLRGVDMVSEAGCFSTEYKAFQTQARVWQAFYGAHGKPQPAGRLDEELNKILDEVSNDPQGFAADLAATYSTECDR